MSNFGVVLVAIKEDMCTLGRLDLRELMKRAFVIEEKMVSKVLVEDDQRRYNTYCERIENFSRRLLADGDVLCLELGSNYLELISKVSSMYPEEARRTRLTASFCPAGMISSYLVQFEEIVKKAGFWGVAEIEEVFGFYQKANSLNMNVVELFQTFVPSSGNVRGEVDFDTLKKSFLDLKISDSITEDRGGGHFVALKNQIGNVVDLTSKGIASAVNFRDLRHDVITEILNEYVYKRGSPVAVSVTYGEGSEARPFPLFSLNRRSDASLARLRSEPQIKVGMMTSRHPELDEMVSVYWFRNQEISIGRTQAETDEVAYQKSKELFESTRSEGMTRFGFYQTGFQPAVVGFCRAMAEELIYRQNQPASLEVTPYYFMGGEYRVGKIWC